MRRTANATHHATVEVVQTPVWLTFGICRGVGLTTPPLSSLDPHIGFILTDVGLSPATATKADEALEQVQSYPVSNREIASNLVFLIKKRSRRIERQISG